jgi:superfamily II DNA or RNA helicase
MTREERQEHILKTIIDNKFVGTIVATPGFGKTKVAINVALYGEFKRILVVSPRTNLKKNWKDELEKWLNPDDYLSVSDFTLENIQTAYKWDANIVVKFDLIIFDEIHTIVTEEYGRLLRIANHYNIPRIGLTGTPDLDEEDKVIMYRELCPIIYEYYGSDKDGLINKRKVYIFKYDLTDKELITVETKSKSWQSGEKKYYDYLEKTIADNTKLIKDAYFLELKTRFNSIRTNSCPGFIFKLDTTDKDFLVTTLSRDLDYFYETTKVRYERRDMSYSLYSALKYMKGVNYATLGLNSLKLLSSNEVPESVKPLIRTYWWAISQRKRMLWTLSSSSNTAKFIKEQILVNPSNKVLLFSELTEQAEKLSEYSIHSHNDKEHNQTLINWFNEGKIRELSSCQSLTLGLNLKGANFAIFESFNSSNTNNEQKSGRTNRLPVEDTASLIYIVPRQTQAENWFDNLRHKDSILIKSMDELINKFK